MKKAKFDLGAGLVLDLPLSVGTLQWGTTPIDQKLINSKGCISETECKAIFSEFCSSGVTLWDTAEGYGGGTSEKRLGRCMEEYYSGKENSALIQEGEETEGSFIVCMTKFLPAPWRYSHGCFERALRDSNKRMNIKCCPIYLIHSPVHWRPLEFWVEAAAICKRKGLLTALGLSNCNAEQVRKAVLAGKKVSTASRRK